MIGRAAIAKGARRTAASAQCIPSAECFVARNEWSNRMAVIPSDCYSAGMPKWKSEDKMAEFDPDGLRHGGGGGGGGSSSGSAGAPSGVEQGHKEGKSGKPEASPELGIYAKPLPTLEKVSTHQLIYSLTGLLVGVLCIVAGLVLFLMGVTGNVGWQISIPGVESNLANATPGVVVFVVGLLIVFITRYTFSVHKRKA